jgi:hypothetical protein
MLERTTDLGDQMATARIPFYFRVRLLINSAAQRIVTRKQVGKGRDWLVQQEDRALN